MKAARQGGDFGPPGFQVEDLSDPHAATEALVRWDELEPEVLRALERDPSHAPRLAKLRAADRWLRTESSGERREPGACPNAEELYDYGRGPGYAQLAGQRRAEIDRHLTRCNQCEFFVETLTAPPPVPFDVAPPAEGAVADGTRGAGSDRTLDRFDPRDDRLAKRSPRAEPSTGCPATTRRPRHLVPMAFAALAASLVVALGLWLAFSGDRGAAPGFPESPLLRGSSGGPLLFPRDRLLLPTDEARAAWPMLGTPPIFELEPQPEATSYRIDLLRHDGSAFATTEDVVRLSGSNPQIAGAPVLGAGHYTWEAWASVRGLDQRLGARDFEVAEDRELCALLVEIASRPEPGRSLAALRLLHDRGWRTDARAIARSLPSTRDRDDYLGQVPGR